ncbi:GNAT family N-acetyltransferase [Piscinibacter sakaiensis]
MARLPSLRRWIWSDGAFGGSIGLRWPADLGPLPPHVLGHIGYAVVPWQRRRGLATRALGEMLDEARRIGLREVDLTTDPDNLASQKVVLAHGGRFVGAFEKPAAYGRAPGWRYRIDLAAR